MRRATAYAHPNVALVKYWGKVNQAFNIPATPSLSICLSGLVTETSVTESRADRVQLNGEVVKDAKILNWLSKLRKTHSIPPVRVDSKSNFPANSGLASSAAGFAALVAALSQAFELNWSEAEKPAYARLGSASAARSVTGGWSTLVPSPTAPNHLHGCVTEQILSPDHWDLNIVVAITQTDPKPVASSEGMLRSQQSSPYYSSWVNSTRLDFDRCVAAVRVRNFQTLAQVAELSCRKMHGLILSTQPSLRYWTGTTLECIAVLEDLQTQNTPVFYTIDAGPQVKAICLPEAKDRVAQRLAAVPGVQQIMHSAVGGAVYT